LEGLPVSPEAQQIAIAEACGWEYLPGEEPTYGGNYKVALWFRKNPIARVRTRWQEKSRIGLPDYLSDLNAMHEAEKVLGGFNDPRWGTYCSYLDDLPSRIAATAAQRAEAFLRTLNLWDDSK